jgi:alanine dehydrogenase
MSIQVGAAALQRANGGRGVLLGGVPGVAPGKVVILGGGISGTHAAQMAVGLQADVTILEKSVPRLNWLADHFRGRARVVMANVATIDEYVVEADLVIGAVLVPGAAAPKLVSRAQVRRMVDGAAVVDIAIDQGGCFETSRPTTHASPTFIEEGVVHYCVTNMPGAVARTSTFALNNVTLPYAAAIARAGWQAALAADPGFAAGLNVQAGKVCHPGVAQALGVACDPFRPAA